ncbi:unnamed protein product [Cylicocyclus nassatus]|uniref:Transthyretin-like family protein n=1 Tax=Cylicocyclus nassatus TaxID=53992 RepID=A0AA36H3W6_CYLNA|nr:unnamed protein product [Cylicocyclus nassatus]
MILGVLAIVNTKLQRIQVRVTLSCFGKPVHGTTVELWKRNEEGPNDRLNATTAFKNGTFYVDGSDDEEDALESFLVIIHNCNVTCKGCYRSVVRELRDSCPWKKKKTIGDRFFGVGGIHLERKDAY